MNPLISHWLTENNATPCNNGRDGDDHNLVTVSEHVFSWSGLSESTHHYLDVAGIILRSVKSKFWH